MVRGSGVHVRCRRRNRAVPASARYRSSAQTAGPDDAVARMRGRLIATLRRRAASPEPSSGAYAPGEQLHARCGGSLIGMHRRIPFLSLLVVLVMVLAA